MGLLVLALGRRFAGGQIYSWAAVRSIADRTFGYFFIEKYQILIIITGLSLLIFIILIIMHASTLISKVDFGDFEKSQLNCLQKYPFKPRYTLKSGRKRFFYLFDDEALVLYESKKLKCTVDDRKIRWRGIEYDE